MFDQLADYLKRSDILWLILPLSVATFVLSLVFVAFLLVKLPATYFVDSRSGDWWVYRHPVIHWAFLILKNVVGLLLVLVGIIQIFTPGQGVLTILIGIMLLNFPGKRRFERWLVSRPKVLAAINKLRKKFNKPPLVLEQPSSGSGNPQAESSG